MNTPVVDYWAPMAPMVHLERGAHHEEMFGQAIRPHSRTLDAVETLFGTPVAEALRRSLENVTEHAGEAFHAYREHRAEVDAEFDAMRVDRDEAFRVLGELTALAVKLADVVEGRARSGPQADLVAKFRDFHRLNVLHMLLHQAPF